MKKYGAVILILLSACNPLANTTPVVDGAQTSALTPTSKGEQLVPGSKGEQLTPGSKGEQLTPTSKGEYKLILLSGELRLPASENLNPNQITFYVDKRQVVPQNVVRISSDTVSFSLPNIAPDHNLVIEAKTPLLNLGTMVPDINTAPILRLDLKSSTLLAVIQKAENENIRNIKDWSAQEFALLNQLPEVSQAEAQVQDIYRSDPSQDFFGSAQVQANIQEILEAFVKKLSRGS